MTSAYAVYEASYTNRVPYITVTEYNNAPTAMDTSNLLPGTAGSVAQQVALQEVIGRASSWIDQYCMGAWGTLCATVEVENARIWGSYRRTLIVHPKYWPLLEVQAFSYTSTPGGLAYNNAASITPAGNITVYPQQFEVAPQGVIGLGFNAPGGIVKGYEYDCQWQYVNGWPTSTLSASVAAGGMSIIPVSVVGMYPGSTMTIYDLPNDEQIQIASTYVPGTSTVPLTKGLIYNHPIGAMVTNLPPAVKQAAILLTTALIKQRGSGAMIIDDMGASTKIADGLTQGEDADIGIAFELLDPLKQKYIGY